MDKDLNYNRELLEKKESCACYFCFEKFHVGDIDEWVDNDEVALCPECRMDSVVPVDNYSNITMLSLMAVKSKYMQEIMDQADEESGSNYTGK